MGDDGGIDPVGLLQIAHRLGKAAHLPGIDDGAGQLHRPEHGEGAAFAASARLHDHEFHSLLAAEAGQLLHSAGIIGKAPRRRAWQDVRIQPALRNIHSTDDLDHGNLPCSCDWSRATIRSYVTMAEIPGSPTVVAGGGTGDTASQWSGWPPGPLASRFHRTKSIRCRYKGGWTLGEARSRPNADSSTPHPSPLPMGEGTGCARSTT
jgi:hypothetical protein